MYLDLRMFAMQMEILSYIIEFAAQTAMLVLALWIMIKIQKLDYSFIGLLGTAALGSGLDMIPYAGHYLAVPALYFCTWKMTRSDLFPDAVFTVVVAYALMFCMNLFLLGALMGDLRPSPGSDDESTLETDMVLTDEDVDSATNQTDVVVAETNGAIQNITNAAASSKKRPATSKKEKAEVDYANVFSVKGITISSSLTTVAIFTGIKTYTIAVGETISMQTSKGNVEVHCEKADGDSVVLTVAGEKIELSP